MLQPLHRKRNPCKCLHREELQTSLVENKNINKLGTETCIQMTGWTTLFTREILQPMLLEYICNGFFLNLGIH